VLGLGDIGPLAAKPVREGKGVLFKRFAGIDVLDIEVASKDPAELSRFCQLLEPTVGGINLEDIRAPARFRVESGLKRTLGIPVFRDDQHGTAIISGAGASAIATANHNHEARGQARCRALHAGLGIDPRVAMISFSNFRLARHPESDKVADAGWPEPSTSCSRGVPNMTCSTWRPSRR